MIVLFTAAALMAQSSPANRPLVPTRACFEALSEGEIPLKAGIHWRREAILKLNRMRVATDRRRSQLDANLAKNREARDRLQRDFDLKTVEEDDFNASRSEIEMEARRLIAERDTPQLPACGF